MFNSAGIVYLLLYAAAIIAVIILVVVLVRFLIAATRARDAETAERKLRTDLLIAERGRDPTSEGAIRPLRARPDRCGRAGVRPGPVERSPPDAAGRGPAA